MVAEGRSIEELRTIVAANPGARENCELAAKLLELPENRGEAREVCFRGLTAEQNNVPLRLTLAKSFYLDQLPEFCVRELLQIQRVHPTPALARLIEAFGSYVNQFSSAAPTASASSATPAPNSGNVSGEGGGATTSSGSEETVIGEIEIDADFDDVEDELGS